jgi:hypothetical protein
MRVFPELDSSLVKRNIQNAAMLFGLATLMGCASSGMTQHAGPVATSTPVSIDFALVETSSALGGLETEKQLLETLIVSGLRGRDVFEEVGGDPAAAGASSGMIIKVVVKEIKQVSQSEREWAGALAGRARILVEATVSDLSSGKLIETFAAEGESSGGSNLAGTTDEAIQRAAEQVVAQVINISSQTRP